MSDPEIKDEHLSVVVDASALGPAVQRVIVSALSPATDKPPQAVNLERFTRRERVELPVRVQTGQLHIISASAITDKRRIFAAPIDFE